MCCTPKASFGALHEISLRAVTSYKIQGSKNGSKDPRMHPKKDPRIAADLRRFLRSSPDPSPDQGDRENRFRWNK
ncbi:hypothetical protein PV325_001861 [Microctonus aethiopoides]|nr:hypothetical protein PV325_001861 [Microctonus aethiopoides]